MRRTDSIRYRGVGDWLREAWSEAWSQDLERRIDEGIRRTLALLRVAKRNEVDALGKRVERIARRIEALRAGRR